MQWKINQANMMENWGSGEVPLRPLELSYGNHKGSSLMRVLGEPSEREKKTSLQTLNGNELEHVKGPKKVKVGTMVGEQARGLIMGVSQKGSESSLSIETIFTRLHLLLGIIGGCGKP